MGKKIGGASLAVLLLVASTVARAQTKQPATPPVEKQAEIKRTPFKPGPLLLFKVPTMQGSAGDQEVEDETLQLFMKSEDMPSSKYLQNRYATEAPLAMATRDISLDKRLQNMTRTFEFWSQMGVLRELDRPGFEAVGRCMTAGLTIKDAGGNDITITPSSPRIGEECLKSYQADAAAFVKDKTGLSDSSIMGQVFGGATLTFAMTYVGDARIEKEGIRQFFGDKEKTAQDGSKYMAFQNDAYYQPFMIRRDVELSKQISTALGGSCELQPSPLVWDTNLPSSGIDIPAPVLKEAYSDASLCAILKTALAGEALKREVDFVMTQIALAQADMTLHPLARDQLAWWHGSLEKKISRWEQEEIRTGAKFEDVIRSIQEARAARLRPLLNAIQTPVVP
ncbi:MAG: hypothetical protein HYT87_00015 [Nitrospirae bacterium]|nr:hypothetical protein [Nitrospirota bacterium]